MSNTSKTQAAAAQSAQVANPQDVAMEQNPVVPTADVEVDDVDVATDDKSVGFARINWNDVMAKAKATKTTADVVRECLADPNRFQLYKSMEVKNVVTTVTKGKDNRPYTRTTFVLRKNVPGMVKDEEHLDAFGEPTQAIGATPMVMTNASSLSGAMKDVAKNAVFAEDVSKITATVVGNTDVSISGEKNIPNILYAGGTIDVLCEYVPANTEYRNPFAREDKEVRVWPEDRILHHIIALHFGEVGEDYYHARLLSKNS